MNLAPGTNQRFVGVFREKKTFTPLDMHKQIKYLVWVSY